PLQRVRRPGYLDPQGPALAAEDRQYRHHPLLSPRGRRQESRPTPDRHHLSPGAHRQTAGAPHRSRLVDQVGHSVVASTTTLWPRSISLPSASPPPSPSFTLRSSAWVPPPGTRWRGPAGWPAPTP